MDQPHPPDRAAATSAKPSTHYGLRFFVVYLLLYAGFMLLNAFAAPLMERELFAGINLAIGYGMGLIFVAVLMAVIYGWLCRTAPNEGEAGR